MKLIIVILCFVLFSCSGPKAKLVYPNKGDVIENPFVQFKPPYDNGWNYFDNIRWSILSKQDNTAQEFRLSSQFNKSFNNIKISTYPYKWVPIAVFFGKNADYEARNLRGKYNPKNIARRLEQGIYYNETWITYIKGLKCNGTVFSRRTGGVLESINSKNYAIGCGYYHKTEGKRILRIGYRYSYADGKVRHKNDKTPVNSQLTKEDAENYLKQTVAQLIETIKIKDVDWIKMEQEGLIHEGEKLDMSSF